MKAHFTVLVEALRSEYYDGRNPTHHGDVAEHGGGTRRDAGERILPRLCLRGGGSLAVAAFGAIDIDRRHLVPALCAERHSTSTYVNVSSAVPESVSLMN